MPSRNPHPSSSAHTHGHAHHAHHGSSSSYTRPTGPEIVAPHLPSCSCLPEHWSAVHDRFIAYLATHAPLTGEGRVPASEELEERWRTADIVRLLRERFPVLAEAVSSFFGF